MTDAVGELLSVDERFLVVQTRRGPVTVRRQDVVTAKEVPPAPARRGRPHLAVGMGDLQELMAHGLPGLHQQWLGRWLMRSADGYTGRANSVLPLGDPGAPLDVAMRRVVGWYADRGRPPLLQLFGPTGFDPVQDALGAWVLPRGWQVFQRTLVMTASSTQLAGNGASAAAPAVQIRPAPDEQWWAGSQPREQEHRETLTAMLAAIPEQAFLTATAGDGAAAVGRVVFTAGWAGVFAVHVLPEHRRQGLARAVTQAAARAAVARGARSIYLQVSADNEPAIALYRSLGFVVHHEYVYARPS